METDFQNPSLLDKENEELLITDERNVEEEIKYELCFVGTFLGERMVNPKLIEKLLNIWCPLEGASMKSLNDNYISFNSITSLIS